MEMRIDFSQLPLRNTAFSVKPMTFCDEVPKRFLSLILDVIAIETGRQKARENWQKAQLRNLLRHAHDRSAFWRKRIGTKKISDLKLSDLPILTRSDVIHQVKSEGPLLSPDDGRLVGTHSTSGSSGTPVEFFMTDINEYYNEVRRIAQYLMEGRDLSLNRTRLLMKSDLDNGFTVDITESWLGSLGGFFESGINKHVNYWHPDGALLLKELSKHPIGYLVVQPRFLEELFCDNDFHLLKTYQTEIVIPLGEDIGINLRKTLGIHKNTR